MFEPTISRERARIADALTEPLFVEAAGLNGFGADPAPNVLVVSVTDQNRRPVGGLGLDNFKVVNYSQTDAHARLVQLRAAVELTTEIPGSGIPGVYKVEPEREPEITGQVGQTAYAVLVTLTMQTPTGSVTYAGQTVLSIVMQPRP